MTTTDPRTVVSGFSGGSWASLAGSSHILDFPSLDRRLRGTLTVVDDAGMEHLRGLTKLEELELRDTLVSDGALLHLKELNRLVDLDLSGTHVTDSGLVHLKGLACLERLSLYDTQVTDEGTQMVQHTLPNCTIFR